LRAIYHAFADLFENSDILIEGESAHHLNVVRVKIDEMLLLLNGQGSIVTGKITALSKNQVSVKVQKVESFVRQHELSLAIANPKKDAFEDILKAAVELGVKNIYPLSSDFSQYDYVASERVARVMESALIQSNNPFFPAVHSQQSLKEFLSTHQDQICFFNSKPSQETSVKAGVIPKTILIGPEGGFSSGEISAILAFPKIQEIHLPTPILRAPTAVAASIGYLLAKQ